MKSYGNLCRLTSAKWSSTNWKAGHVGDATNIFTLLDVDVAIISPILAPAAKIQNTKYLLMHQQADKTGSKHTIQPCVNGSTQRDCLTNALKADF